MKSESEKEEEKWRDGEIRGLEEWWKEKRKRVSQRIAERKQGRPQQAREEGQFWLSIKMKGCKGW